MDGVAVPLDALHRHALPVRSSNGVPYLPLATLAHESSEQVLITPTKRNEKGRTEGAVRSHKDCSC